MYTRPSAVSAAIKSPPGGLKTAGAESSISSFPKVSVLIPLYNAEPYIAQTIESVLAQTYPNIEMVIVDDGSSDGSYAMAQSYANRYRNILLVKQKNRGPGATRNCAFNLSTGDYIQYLDADDLLAPDKIALQMVLLTDYGDKTLIFGSGATFHKDIDTSTFLNFPYFKNYDNPLNFLIDYWGEGGMIAISSLLIPRTTVAQAGRWNERWILNEDGEFISRVIQKMQRVIYLEESIAYYRKENPKSF
jgi:glycosyltransferase involved in cell wall biosynthesis